MAGKQDLIIGIKTTYDGKGISSAHSGLTGLQTQIGKTSGKVGKLGGAVGKLGGSFGKLGGAIGKASGAAGVFGSVLGGLGGTIGTVATGIEALILSLRVLSGPVGLAVAALSGIVWVFTKMNDKAEKAKQSMIDHRKEMHRLRVEAEIARETAEDEASKKRQEALEKERERAEALTKELWKTHAAEVARQKANNELTKQRIKNETALALLQEKDESKKPLIEAQGDLKLTKAGNQEAVKEANLKVAEEMAKLKTLTNRIGNDKYDQGFLKEQIAQQTKAVDEAKIKAQAAKENETAQVQMAQIKVENAQIAYDKEQEARQEQEANEALIKAQEQAQKETEDFYRSLYQKEMDRAEQDKAALEQQLGKIDEELEAARKAIQEGKDVQVTVDAGTARDPGYNYPRNSDGDIRDPANVARAKRFADRAKRDAESQNIGGNLAKRKKARMKELQDKKRKGRRMEPWEMNELDAIEDWDKQRNARAAEKNVPELLKKQQETQDKIKTAAETIKDLLEKLGIK